MTYIQFKNIHKSFGTNHVLNTINLDLEEGKFITLLGPSGCGKSTLLRCLAGLENIDEGTIYLDGEDITNLPVEKRAIGMVFQQYSLFPNMTVEQNIAFGLKMKKLDKGVIREKVAAMIELVQLEGKEKQYPAQLSGGQQQRVALARAIVTEPKVLLLDEPLSAIDAQLRRKLQIQIRSIQQKLNMTTLFVTHDQDEAMIMSDTIHLFNEGKIEQSGTPVELYTHPKTKFVASFMGHYNVLEGESFSQVTGYFVQAKTVAIRPEVLQLYSEMPEVNEEYIMIKGKITDFISRGNILRYYVEVGEKLKLKVDVLFRTHALYNVNEEIYIGVEKRNCIPLD